jgi:hypothetical protein
MAIFDLFSKRQKMLRGEVADVYQYNDFPNPFRVQVIHIWTDVLGHDGDFEDESRKSYEYICNTLCREYGLFRLTDERCSNREHIANFFLRLHEPEKILDVIELSFKVVDDYIRRLGGRIHGGKISSDDAIFELNQRFNEHGIGYQFESGEIVRMDSKLVHSEVVKPALSFLQEKIYAGANDEFLRAHEHYRHKRYKECLNECLKAFESIMKAICKKRRWKYAETDTAKTLLDICFKNGLVEPFWQSHFTGLRATLESGIPTVRNKTSGHGQGTDLTNVPPTVASYVLHLTATILLFLANAEKDLG